MIPVSNKTRSITRVRYKHASFQGQEKCDYNSYASRIVLRANLNRFICRASVSDAAGLKMRLTAESSHGETIETKLAAILRQPPHRRRHHPDHLHPPHRRRPRPLCLIAARQ